MRKKRHEWVWNARPLIVNRPTGSNAEIFTHGYGQISATFVGSH